MKTKHFVAACAIPTLLLLAGMAVADDAPATQPAPTTRPAETGGRARPGIYLNRLHELVNGLDLSADQKPKVDALFAKATDDIKSAIASAREPGADRQEVGQKIRTIMDSVRNGLKGILSEDQVQSLQSKLPGLAPATARGPAQLLQRVTAAFEKLDLSDDQKKQVTDILKASRDKFEKIRGAAKTDSTEAHDKVRAAIEETRQKLENVLTPDQKEKFRQLQQERERGNSPATAPQ